MALVDTTTGEVVTPLDEAGARDLTERIKAAAEQVWALLLEAHERRAWTALGYETWESYVKAEFGMGRAHAYRLLDQGQVIRAIENAVSPIGDTASMVDAADVTHGLHRAPVVDINEHQARKLKPHLADVTNKVRERVTHATEVETAVPPERVQEIVGEVVAEALGELKQKQEDAAAIRALNEKYQPPGFDPAEDRRRTLITRSLINAIATIRELPPIPEFVSYLWPEEHYHLDDDLEPALTWLTDLAETWRKTA